MVTAKPVSDEEYAEAYSNKDNRLVIRKVISGYSRQLPEDCLESCGLSGLWRALKSHKGCFGQKFTTSLYRFVRWECLQALRRKRDHVSWDSDMDIPERLRLEDDQIGHIKECLGFLDSTSQDLVRKHYLDEMTFHDIAKELGVSDEMARQKVARAFNELCFVAKTTWRRAVSDR